MDFGMPTLLENKDIDDCVALCRKLSLDFIELNMNFPQYQIDGINLRYYKELMERNHIYFTIHLEEELNVCGYNKEVRAAYLKTVRQVIEIAKQLNAPVINMHMAEGIYVTLPGERVYLFGLYQEQYIEMLKEFRNICEDSIGDSEIKICIENSGGFSQYAMEGIELLLSSKVFALTFDLGHDHAIGGKDEPFIRRHKDRLIHMHVHDAIGGKNHLAVGTGEIDLKDKLALAKECNCRCVLETKTIAGLTESVGNLKGYL
jgi:sugar phosphate isomerase/epimerase